MNVLKKIFSSLKSPSTLVLVIAYLLTVGSIAGVIITFVVGVEGGVLEIISYILYALSAITLSYSVYTIVIFAPKWKKSIINNLNKYNFTRRLFENYGYRAIIFAFGALLFGLAYGAFLLVLSIANKSAWYGVLAGFYILMSICRMFVVLSRKNNSSNVDNKAETEMSYAKTHRNCGILLIIATFSISVAVIQMVLLQRSFSYNGIMIYVAATYAFYKITLAIINLFKKRSREDLNLEAIRNINLSDAMVSILALQTALLRTFGTENYELTMRFNALTGGIICALMLALGISMIIVGAKAIKKIKTENINGK